MSSLANSSLCWSKHKLIMELHFVIILRQMIGQNASYKLSSRPLGNIVYNNGIVEIGVYNCFGWLWAIALEKKASLATFFPYFFLYGRDPIL